MMTIRVHDDDGRGRVRGRLTKVTGLVLGVALFGTVGLSGALAQADDVTVGSTDAESIIAAIFAEIFGGGVAEDESTISGGDINVGGNMGSNVTMGGGTSGGITVGGGSGGLSVGDDSGS
jgi:hypothetical protein